MAYSLKLEKKKNREEINVYRNEYDIFVALIIRIIHSQPLPIDIFNGHQDSKLSHTTTNKSGGEF